jgi:hypothetical protein
MRNNYDLSGNQGGRYHTCGLCGKKWYESLIRACPKREGKKVCMYCCRMCPEHHRDEGGQSCGARNTSPPSGSQGTP